MPIIASAIVGGVGMVTSGIKSYKANKALKELQKQELPQYSVSPEMRNAYGRAEGMTGRGFTPQEEAAFRANLATSENTARMNAMNQSGGNMSQAILGGLNARNVGALNQFAAQDASQRRANIAYADNLAGQLQQQENIKTGQEVNYRMTQEQAYGKALQDNLNQMQSSFNYGITMGLGGMDFGKKPGVIPGGSQGGQGQGFSSNPFVSNPDYKMQAPVTPSIGVVPPAFNPIVFTGGVNGAQYPQFGANQFGTTGTGSQFAPFAPQYLNENE